MPLKRSGKERDMIKNKDFIYFFLQYCLFPPNPFTLTQNPRLKLAKYTCYRDKTKALVGKVFGLNAHCQQYPKKNLQVTKLKVSEPQDASVIFKVFLYRKRLLPLLSN